MGINLSVAMNVSEGLNENLIRMNPSIGMLCCNRLKFHRNYDLFEKVEQLDSKEIDFDVRWYDDEGIEVIDIDPYGDKLRYVLANEFNKIKISDFGIWNNSILRFLQNIPGDTVVILYWH